MKRIKRIAKRLLTISILILSYSSLQGQEWRSLGPFKNTIPLIDSGFISPHGVGRLHALALLDNKGKRMVVASSTGGTFITKNYGKTWSPNYSYTYMTGANRIQALSKRHFWIATCSNHMATKHWGLGILETRNRGKSWKATGLEKYPSEYDLCCLYDLQFQHKSKKIAYTLSENTVWKTSNKGKQWDTVFFDSNASFRNLLVSKQQKERVWLAGKKLYKSADGGNKFEDMTPQIKKLIPQNIKRICVAYFDKKENTLFCLVLAHQAFILKSTDQGATWEITNRNAGLFSEHELGIWSFTHQNKSYVLLGGIRAFLSSDSGQTVQQITFPNLTKNFVHDDIRDVKITKKGHLYLAHDGGLSMSKDLGKTWTNLNGEGLSVTQFYGMSNSEAHPHLFYAGTLDMSTKIYRDSQWYCLSKIYADGGRARMHPQDSSKVYISKSGYAFRLDSMSGKWLYAHPFSKRADFDFPMDFDKNAHHFYMVTDHLWRRSGNHQMWENLTNHLPASRDISTFTLSPHNENDIWFARKEQTWSEKRLFEKLYYSPDGGKNWEDKTFSLPILAWRYIRHIHISPNNDSLILVGLGDFDEPNAEKPQKIYASYDKGNTWINISNGLPNFPVNFINSYQNYLFAATDVGVYVKKPSATLWEPYGVCLPPVVCKEIHINHSLKAMRVATFGRGIWEVNLPDIIQQ